MCLYVQPVPVKSLLHPFELDQGTSLNRVLPGLSLGLRGGVASCCRVLKVCIPQALPLGDTSELYGALLLMLGGLESKPYGWPVNTKPSQLTVSTQQLAQKDASRSVCYPRAMLEKRDLELESIA